MNAIQKDMPGNPTAGYFDCRGYNSSGSRNEHASAGARPSLGLPLDSSRSVAFQQCFHLVYAAAVKVPRNRMLQATRYNCKSVKGPLPQASLMPTGGFTLANVAEWIKAGSVAVGVGGNLTAGAKTGDFSSITQLAQQFAEKNQRRPRPIGYAKLPKSTDERSAVA
jgi:hypothetical protein